MKTYCAILTIARRSDSENMGNMEVCAVEKGDGSASYVPVI